jgi:exopolyphosphatase/pppGpp-phosphohydrolase
MADRVTMLDTAFFNLERMQEDIMSMRKEDRSLLDELAKVVNSSALSLEGTQKILERLSEVQDEHDKKIQGIELWRARMLGMALACSALSGIIFAVVQLALRVALFGEPLSKTGGLLGH